MKLIGEDCAVDLHRVAREFKGISRGEVNAQNQRALGLWRRLYEQDEPGVLLADEVGKGKTWVALAVARARLHAVRRSRVLILTHSTGMARQWAKRWQRLVRDENDSAPTSALFTSIDDLVEAAESRCLPDVTFASYETLKRYDDAHGEAALLRGALDKAYQLRGLKFRAEEKAALVAELFEGRSFRRLTPAPVSDRAAKRILQCLDGREWRAADKNAVQDQLDRLHASERLPPRARFDLLIVDEAHKLDGTARHRVLTRLLGKRFNKCVLVTATPFALRVEQFRRRLLDFAHARAAPAAFKEEIGKLELEEFQTAVAQRAPFAQKAVLERRLRRHLVRASWGKDERELTRWQTAGSHEALLPTLALERMLHEVLDGGRRTHIASRRESLCSSWAAAAESLRKSPLPTESSRWGHAFEALVHDREDLDPKVCAAVEQLAALVAGNTKVVVFTQRLETSKLLEKLLRRHPLVKKREEEHRRRADSLRRHVDRASTWLDIGKDHAAGVLKVMAHSPDRPTMKRDAVRRWWKRHGERLSAADPDGWQDLKTILGHGTRLPVVVRHDADTGAHERNLEKFNLPSAPLVLIATPKAQEGIDLHHYCRHVVLFDLTWNPAAMEQRVGRVHRLGGVRKKGEKVNVTYCFQEGTYEAVMAQRVQRRCEMMRALLGAGQWLDEDKEIEDLRPWEMTFPP